MEGSRSGAEEMMEGEAERRPPPPPPPTRSQFLMLLDTGRGRWEGEGGTTLTFAGREVGWEREEVEWPADSLSGQGEVSSAPVRGRFHPGPFLDIR